MRRKLKEKIYFPLNAADVSCYASINVFFDFLDSAVVLSGIILLP